MAKSKKSKPSAGRKDYSPSARCLILNIMLGLMFATTLGLGFRYVDAYVEKRVVFPTAPPRVVLTDRPAWMSDFLAEQIIRTVRPVGTHSAFDHQMLVDTVDLLRGNPWIRKVRQVRRVYGDAPGDTLEIDCEYRALIALVKWLDYYWLVDGDGFKLPEQYTPKQLDRIMFGSDGHTNIRIIQGVTHPPVETGCKWPGDDLAAGIALVKLLYGQPYAEAISVVNVSNFKGRHDPNEVQLVLVTKDDTEVRWGRPPADNDFFIEVPVGKKLQRLKEIYEQYGRVDAGQKWIDIRFDKPTTPTAETASAKDTDAR